MPPRVTVTMRPLSLHPLSLLTFSLLLLTLLVPPANTRYLRSVSRQQVPPPTLTPTPSAPPFQPSPESPPESSDRPPPLTSPSASPSQPIAPSAQLTPTPPIASFASSPALGNPSSTSTPDASISLTVSPEPLETERETQSPSSSSPVSPTPSQIPVSLSPNSRSPSAQPSISSSPLPSSSVEATSLPDSNSPTVSLSPSSRAKRKTRVTPSLQTTPSPSILPSPFPSPTLNLDDSSEQPSPLVSQAENQTSQSTSPDQSPPNLPTASPSPAQSTAQPFSPSNSANDTVDVEISGGPSGEATDDTDTEGGSGANVTGSSSEDQQADTTRPTSEPSPSSSSQSSPSASLTLPPSPESDPPNVIPSPEVTASFSDGALSSPTVPDIILESEMPSEEPSPTITPVGADIIASASSLSASPSSLPVETEIAEGIQSFTITPEPSLVAPRLPSNDSSFSSESPQPSAASGGLSPLLSSLITASPSNIPVVSVSVSEEVVPMLAETVIPRESRSVESSQVILPSAEVEMSISQSSTPATSEQGISTQDNVDVTPESSQIAAVSSSAGVVPSARGPSPSLILEGEVSAENETEATPQVFVSLAPSPSTDSASVGSESMLPLPTEQEETLEVSVTPTTESSTTDMMTPFPSLSPSQSEALRPSPVGQEELISESASPIMSNSPFDVTPSFATIMPSLIEPVVSVPIDFEEASEASMAPLPTMSPPPPLESPREASQVPSEPSFTVSVEQEDAVAASVVPDPEASAPSITSPQATLSASYSASLSPAEVGLIDAENPVDGGEIETPEITPSMTLSPTVEATAGNEPTDVLTTGQGISEENFMTPTPSALEFAAVSQEASQADTELTAIPVIDEGEVEGEDESTQSPETSNSVTASSSATPSAAIVGTQPISTFELDEQASAPSVASPTAEMSFEGIPIPSAAIEQDELVRNTIMPMPSVSAAMRSPGVQTLASEGTLAPSLPTEQLFEGGSLQPTAEISVPIVSPSSLRPSPGMSEGAASALSEQGESTEEGTTPVPITSESEVFESSAIITPSRSPMITVAIEQEDMTMVSADPSLEMSPSSSTDSLPFTSQGVDEPLATDTAESSDPLPSGSARPPQITSDDGNSSGNSITSATETITTPEASFMGHASQSVDEPLASSVALEDNELEEDMAPSESSSLPFSSISPNAIEISSMPVTISPEPSHTESSTASRDATPSPAPQTENISVPTPEVVQMTLTASQPPEISDSAPVGIPIATMSITDGEVFEAISPSSGPSEEQPNPTVDDEVDVSTSEIILPPCLGQSDAVCIDVSSSSPSVGRYSFVW
eukprot:GFKZ01006071.1.p1 GENE.GFKZ01006071.1~~GFKZ01006071.1.p1  ORF type:complete len:1318 (-),score=178.54 GFKZ01006071.1:143-4096(-)